MGTGRAADAARASFIFASVLLRLTPAPCLCLELALQLRYGLEEVLDEAVISDLRRPTVVARDRGRFGAAASPRLAENSRGSATWKMGASASLLIATMVFESFMPERCWIAPEMPTAT